MSHYGIAMFITLCLAILLTGLPVWALLLGVSSLFAAFAVVSGDVSWTLFAVLGERLLGLLADDLLQAIAIFVFIGILLHKLPIASAVYEVIYRLLPGKVRPPVRQAVASLTLGAMVAPMNGSAASSAALMGRLLGPRLRRQESARSTALLGAAATIGVVVPPSLVLLLLGEKMMMAHLEASRLPGYALEGIRIVNTQDILRAALIPALMVVLAWLLVAAWQAHRAAETSAGGTHSTSAEEVPPLSLRTWVLAILSVGTLLFLLGGVFMGKLMPVEAAATGGTLLVLGTVLTRRLSWGAWRLALTESLQLSGALIALLIGATTFVMVFRAFGTDRWLAETLLSMPVPFLVAGLIILALVALCALVLDAFEMIFVIVPIVAPAFIVFMGDPRQAAVLLLFVLQLSFLIPPMGYAVLMVQNNSGLDRPPVRLLLRRVAPYALVQLMVMAAIFTFPQLSNLLAGEHASLVELDDTMLDDAMEMMRNMGGRDWDEED